MSELREGGNGKMTITEELYQRWYSQTEDIRYALQWMMSYYGREYEA